MSGEVTVVLAAFGAECYRLGVESPVDLMDTLVQAKSGIHDAARVHDVDDQEKGMSSRWDAYRALEVRDVASRSVLERAGKRIE